MLKTNKDLIKLENLPSEIILEIIKKLSVKDALALRNTNKLLKSFVDDPTVWAAFIKRDFGSDNKEVNYQTLYRQFVDTSAEAITLLAFLDKPRPNHTNLTPVFNAERYPRESVNALREWSALNNSDTAKKHALQQMSDKLKSVISFLSKPFPEGAEDHTPLAVAVAGRDYAAVDLFLRYEDFDVNALSGEEQASALYHAADLGRTKMVTRLLKDPRTKVNQLAGDGSTALHTAVTRGNLGATLELLKHKAINPNIRDYNDYIPLSACIDSSINDHREESECLPYIQALVNHPEIDLSLLDSSNQTVLAFALESNYLQCAQIISTAWNEKITAALAKETQYSTAQPILHAHHKRRDKNETPSFSQFKAEFASHLNLSEGRLRLVFRAYAERTEQLEALIFVGEIPNETVPTSLVFSAEEQAVLETAVAAYQSVEQELKRFKLE